MWPLGFFFPFLYVWHFYNIWPYILFHENWRTCFHFHSIAVNESVIVESHWKLVTLFGLLSKKKNLSSPLTYCNWFNYPYIYIYIYICYCKLCTPNGYWTHNLTSNQILKECINWTRAHHNNNNNNNNCRVTISSPSPKELGYEPNTINL